MERAEKNIERQHSDLQLLRRGPAFLAASLLGGVIAIAIVAWIIIVLIG